MRPDLPEARPAVRPSARSESPDPSGPILRNGHLPDWAEQEKTIGDGNGLKPQPAAGTTERYYEFIGEHPEISERDIRIIAEWMPGARRIVDVGCGAGGFVAMCRERLGDAVGMDSSPGAVRLCRAGGLPAVLADGAGLPFASGSLEVVRAKEVMEHILHLLPFVQEVYRVLQPGGLFLSETPTQYSILYPVTNFYDDFTHVRPLTRRGVRRLLAAANFEALFVRGYTAGRNPLERLLGRVLGVAFPFSWVALARKPTASPAR